MMDFKNFKNCELKAKNDLEFEGYASVFGVKDSWDDIVEEGAFKKTIKEQKKRIKVLAQHDFMSVIGRPTTLEEDKKGLYFVAKLSDTTQGRDTFTLVKDNVLTEMSIGYNPVKWEYDEESGIRYLKEIRLWEISPVTWAANPEAAISKHMNQKYDILEKEIKRLEALIKNLTDEPPRKITDSGIQSAIDEVKKWI